MFHPSFKPAAPLPIIPPAALVAGSFILLKMKLTTHLDLFSGIGGFALAARWNGLTTVAFTETNEHCSRVLARQFPGVPNLGDVRLLTAKKIAHHGLLNVDLITASWPCSDVSNLGEKGLLKDERSGLWYECARIIREARPKLVLLENVPSIIAGDGGVGLGSILRDLAKGGFDAEWAMFDASRYGVRQCRSRCYIVANDNRRVRAVARQRPVMPIRGGTHPFGESQPIPYRNRIACGLSDRVDIGHRITACANAVAPQIPYEIIGCAAEKFERLND